MQKLWYFFCSHFNTILLWLRIPAQFTKYIKYTKANAYGCVYFVQLETRKNMWLQAYTMDSLFILSATYISFWIPAAQVSAYDLTDRFHGPRDLPISFLAISNRVVF